MNMKKRMQKGFTLIEVMVTVAIIGILAAVAIPNYSDYVTNSRFAEATSGLANKRIQMEQFYQDNRTYVGGPACANDTLTSTVFTFSCPTLTASTYTIQAVGSGRMTGFTFNVNESNAKATTAVASGWTTAACWIRGKGGAC